MDLLVNLLDLDYHYSLPEGVRIERVLASDFYLVEKFVAEEFLNAEWVSEVKAGLKGPLSTVLIAIKEQNVIGFACYDCTAKGFFGPFGVAKSQRYKGVGEQLALKTFEAMKSVGYAYAIIGWASQISFYQLKFKAVKIEEGNNVYARRIRF